MTDATSQESSERSSASRKATPPTDHRLLWIAVMALFALIAGTLAGLLAFAGDAKLPAAVLTAGTAFAGTVLLLLTVAHYLDRE
ncbi:hypothetical protein [Actinoplanes regularis]|uniref:Uncharacterized protein n=1 Tax=Actinoplanes regularis TaxID=52697 RepID=A0A238YZE4_9ACTN|nr:hypothetical protein [Actinoplanes regularis]GIE85680.1 hypothetical protein Are01nite_21600 [Actinoplanes regularis]GLW29305.1 hypothetical protein Areg01_22450 [Actinoplanes regularis]SNR76382.1 hypothetical protein SAMN06264365_105299 [Actinoplanes regularis]